MFAIERPVGYAAIIAGLALALAVVVYGRGLLGLIAAATFIACGYGLVRQANLEDKEDRENALAADRENGSQAKEM